MILWVTELSRLTITDNHLT